MSFMCMIPFEYAVPYGIIPWTLDSLFDEASQI